MRRGKKGGRMGGSGKEGVEEGGIEGMVRRRRKGVFRETEGGA